MWFVNVCVNVGDRHIHSYICRLVRCQTGLCVYFLPVYLKGDTSFNPMVPIGSNLRFSVLPKDTSVCGQGD